MKLKNVLLTFDIEEFDIPLEFGGNVEFSNQISVSEKGCYRILEILEKHKVKATFFTTAVFAENAKSLIKKIVENGHEIGSHGWSHSHFEMSDLEKSKIFIESLIEKKIVGFRMPRLKNVDFKAMLKAGYKYDSSINPTYLPGRYNNIHEKKIINSKDGITEIPVTVTPFFRIPLFWLSFRHIPFGIYMLMVFHTLSRRKYVNLYLHPWEFVDPKILAEYGLPYYIYHNSGKKLEKKLEMLILLLKKKSTFICCHEMIG